MRLSYSHRLFMYGPVGALFLLVLGYVIFWTISANAFSKRLDAVNGREIMPGVVFAFAGKDIGGFPFRRDAILSGVTITHPGEAGETAWRTERLAIHALSYRGGRYIFEADGLQSIARPGGGNGPPRVLHVTPGIARASAVTREGRLVRFDADLRAVGGRDATLDAAPDRTVSARRIQVHLRDAGTESFDIAASLEGGTIGAGFTAPLGRDIASLSLTGQITEGGTLRRLTAGAEAPDRALAQWRDATGALAVEAFSVLSETGPGRTFTGRLVPGADFGLRGTLVDKDGTALEIGGDPPR